ncbi:MAG TPA: hypothetical protein VGQ91_09080 [Ideonella sp.]|jgi:hypothetical protein|nr:hypothetical protein [Ideonella sp.]
MNTRPVPLAATLLLAAAMAAPTAAHAAVACVDFLAFPDNAALAENFNLGGFGFHDRAGGFMPFVNVFVDVIGQPVHGMQFDKRSLRIKPPVPALSVDLRVGAFAGAGLTIQAYDAVGGLQDNAGLPNDATMHTVTLTAATAPIALIKLKGGGYEGIVNGLCSTS